MKGEQLPLAVQLAQAPTLDNFFAGPNADVVDALRLLAKGAGASQVLVTGGTASGKSHLLRAAAAAATPAAGVATAPPAGAVSNGAVWNGATASAPGEAVYAACASADLPALRDVAWLALDDIDAAGESPEAAIPLLRLIDARRAAGRPLLLAAGAPPSRLPAALADLRTRLSAMLLLPLKPLRDTDRRELLRVQARERGLSLPDDVANWLLGHFTRDAGSLIGVLEELDRAALSAQRRLTLPFVQSTLAQRLQPPLDL